MTGNAMADGAKIFIVDDDASVRMAVKRLLTSAGYDIEAFSSADGFLNRTAHTGPACVILDLAMPEMDGLALQQRLQQRDPSASIVFLSGHGELHSGVQAMKAGAADFLTKPVDEGKLLPAVSAALNSSANRLKRNTKMSAARARLSTLSPREREVMRLVIAGYRNKQIAFELGISEKTVKVHRAHIMEKAGVRSVAQLVTVWHSLEPESREAARR